MNEHEFEKKITGYLNRGATEIKPGIAFRLQRARQLALARLREPERAPELALAAAGGATFGGRRLLAHARVWIAVLVILGGVVAYRYWEAAQQAHDIEETDAAILSSELPIDAYLDQGFQAWLNHSEP